MNAALDVSHVYSEALGPVPAVLPSSNPTITSGPVGYPVVRRLEQLRLHPALVEFGWMGVIDELNEAARLKHPSVPKPILITPNGTILNGFGRWRLAVFEGKDEIHCIEYPLGEDESLPFILAHHRPRRGWNAFVRIRLALTLEPYFQEKAVDNMRAGGMYKGSTNLPKADRIDVRQEIASAAGTGTGNVNKVKTILRSAHPNIIAALQNGSITIHRAWQWCSLQKLQQKEEFARYEEDRIQRKLVREFVGGHAKLEPAQVIEALRLLETHDPGRIAIRKSRNIRTVVIIGQDLLESAEDQKDLDRHD